MNRKELVSFVIHVSFPKRRMRGGGVAAEA